MRIDEEVFRRKMPVVSRLSDYGFVRNNGIYHYSEVFHEGQFRCDVTVDAKGMTVSHIIDTDLDEEFRQVNMESFTGEYIATVRGEYQQILERIAAACYQDVPFILPQANRISMLIEGRFGETRDYPFSKLPAAAVFRCRENRKWYGLVMAMDCSLIDKDKKLTGEVLNVKTEDAVRLTSIAGIYPGYHMNRKNWISIILDDTLPDELIMQLVETSRKLISGHLPAKMVADSWIVPANPQYYDIISAFESDDVIWKQGKGIEKGNTVYMYVGAPVSAVLYRCKVTETMIPLDYADDNVSMRYIMKMKVEKRYEMDFCPFSVLRELGIRAVRGPRKVTRQFLEYVSRSE